MDSQEEPTVPDEKKDRSIDFSNAKDLLELDDELYTIETWEENLENIRSGYEISGYGWGQMKMVNILEALLEMKLSGEELTKQLAGFIDERKKFCEFALEYVLKNPHKKPH